MRMDGVIIGGWRPRRRPYCKGMGLQRGGGMGVSSFVWAVDIGFGLGRVGFILPQGV